MTVAACAILPLVPVTITLYTPAEPSQDALAVDDAPKIMLLGDIVHVRPREGETERVSETAPVKPFWPATETTEIADAAATVVTEVGLALTVKSCIMQVEVVV